MTDSTFHLKGYLKERQALVNRHLDDLFKPSDPDRELIRAIRHSLGAGGKRVRPILAIAAAEALGKDPLPTLPACCAIEMIHTYSLIHDDLPAMDDDDLRRGIPSCHKQFSEATAILAGDALLTHAFTVLAMPEALFETYPARETRLELIARISKAAGLDGMVEGQMLDMQSFTGRKQDTLAHLKKIHALKTGRMITVSVEAGALCAGAAQSDMDRLTRYADRIGLAFQVADDILNIEGDPAVMGKSAGTDQLNDKMTFPAIIGLSESKKYARQLIDEAIEAISRFHDTADPLRAIAEYIINRDH